MTTLESIERFTNNQLALAVGANQSIIRLNSLNSIGLEVAKDLKDLEGALDKIQECKNGVCALNWKPAKN